MQNRQPSSRCLQIYTPPPAAPGTLVFATPLHIVMKVILVVLSVVVASLAGESPLGSFQPGSERGSYHVFLPDGRLQRALYTSAPLQQFQDSRADFLPGSVYYVDVPAQRLQAARSQQAYQQQQISDYNQGAYSNYAPKSAYYVEVPTERLQALLAQQGYQQQQIGRSASYSTPLEVDTQFVPLEFLTVDQLAQYHSQK